MIIANGTATPKMKAGGGIDPSTGYPVAPTVSYGSPVPCQYYPASLDMQARSNGEHYTRRSYIVLVEGSPEVPERFLLKDADGCEVGEFSVIASEYLKVVDETKITI